MMLSNLYRFLIRVTEKVHDPKRSRTLALSRRAFGRALALIAFGGVARPPLPRVVASSLCVCDEDGQCAGHCVPNEGYCPDYARSPAGANCWCQALFDEIMAHVCDCHCPGDEKPYCVCHTIGYAGCGGLA